MGDLKDVLSKLTKEPTADVDLANLPEEGGSFAPPPQPGTYRFRTPKDLTSSWDVVEVTAKDADGNVITKDGQPVKRQRVVLILDRNNPLTIVQSKNKEYDDQTFTSRFSNAERWRKVGKSGEKVQVSDLAYFLRVFKPDAKPKLNQDWIELVNKHAAGKEFSGDIEWSFYCNPEKDAYFRYEESVTLPNGETKTTVEYDVAAVEEGAEEKIKGCGERYYGDKAVKGADGRFEERLECKCGASIRAFANIRNFKQ